MDKFEYARYLRKVAQDNKRTRETIAHKKRVRLAVDASTTNYRGRKRYADGYQTSANEKIDTAQTPIGVRVSTTTKIGPVSMTTTRWASKNRGSNK